MSRFSLVCAIEAGPLEAQTLLMLATLKRFGGELGTAPVTAFQGRRGEKLSLAGRKRLTELDVEYVYRPELNRAPWFNYANKIAAVRHIQETSETPWCIWMDSDILFLNPPSFLRDGALDGTDFHARFEYLPPVVKENQTTFTAYWSKVGQLCGADIMTMGLYDLDLPSMRMRPYFNSGFFLWCAETDFAATYAHNFYRLLSARIAPKGIGPWFADQVSLTPTLAGLDLRWRMLSSEDHLMLFANMLENRAFVAKAGAANVVHYSKSRQPAYRALFDELVRTRRPELDDIPSFRDPVTPHASGHPVWKALKYSRRLRQAIFVRTCREI